MGCIRFLHCVFCRNRQICGYFAGRCPCPDGYPYPSGRLFRAPCHTRNTPLPEIQEEDYGRIAGQPAGGLRICAGGRSIPDGPQGKGSEGGTDRSFLSHGGDPVSVRTSAGDLARGAHGGLFPPARVGDGAGFRRAGGRLRVLPLSDGGRYLPSEAGRRAGFGKGIFYGAVSGVAAGSAGNPGHSNRFAMGRMLPACTFSYGLRSKCADLSEQ